MKNIFLDRSKEQKKRSDSFYSAYSPDLKGKKDETILQNRFQERASSICSKNAMKTYQKIKNQKYESQKNDLKQISRHSSRSGISLQKKISPNFVSQRNLSNNYEIEFQRNRNFTFETTKQTLSNRYSLKKRRKGNKK